MVEEVAELYYEENLTTHEISVILQVPVRWVREALAKTGEIVDMY